MLDSGIKLPSAENNDEEMSFDESSNATVETYMEASGSIEPDDGSDESPFHNDYNINLGFIVLKNTSNSPFTNQTEIVSCWLISKVTLECSSFSSFCIAQCWAAIWQSNSPYKHAYSNKLNKDKFNITCYGY